MCGINNFLFFIISTIASTFVNIWIFMSYFESKSVRAQRWFVIQLERSYNVCSIWQKRSDRDCFHVGWSRHFFTTMGNVYACDIESFHMIICHNNRQWWWWWWYSKPTHNVFEKRDSFLKMIYFLFHTDELATCFEFNVNRLFITTNESVSSTSCFISIQPKYRLMCARLPAYLRWVLKFDLSCLKNKNLKMTKNRTYTLLSMWFSRSFYTCYPSIRCFDSLPYMYMPLYSCFFFRSLLLHLKSLHRFYAFIVCSIHSPYSNCFSCKIKLS